VNTWLGGFADVMLDYTWYVAIGVAVIEAVVVRWFVWDVVVARRRGASYRKLIASKLGSVS
jgi:hypothetical protein